MKKIILLFVLAFSLSINAQLKRVVISETEIGEVSAKYLKSINTETKDTLFLAYLGFQNQKYKSFTDIKSIYFTSQDEINEFVSDLKNVSKEMDSKAEMSWNRTNYSMILFDFANLVYLYQAPRKGSGYTTLNKKHVDKLIEWLESIEFRK